MKRHFTIYKDPSQDEWTLAAPWFIQEDTYGDDRDDYARCATQQDAIATVELMCSLPDGGTLPFTFDIGPLLQPIATKGEA